MVSFLPVAFRNTEVLPLFKCFLKEQKVLISVCYMTVHNDVNLSQLITQHLTFKMNSPCYENLFLQTLSSFNNMLRDTWPNQVIQTRSQDIRFAEIRRPCNSNYVSSPNVVSWVTNTGCLYKKYKPKSLNTGVCTVHGRFRFYFYIHVHKFPGDLTLVFNEKLTNQKQPNAQLCLDMFRDNLVILNL